MKTLYESILDKDFDVNDGDVMLPAIKEAVNNSVYDDVFDGTVELINDSVVIGWSDFGAREFFFDRLYEGIKTIPIKITSIKFGGKHLKNILLHIPEKAEYTDLKIWANSISICNYTSNYTPEIKLKNFSILSAGNIYFGSVSPIFIGRSRLDCIGLELNQSYITASANTTINVSQVVFSMIPQKLLKILKDYHIYPISRALNLPFNPCDILIGGKVNPDLKKILVFGIYSFTNKEFSLAFTKGSTRLRYGAKNMNKQMKDDWKLWPNLVKPFAE